MRNCGLLSFSRFLAACLVAMALFAAAGAAHAFPATQCPADRKGSDLGCTANDVSITGMSVVGDTTSCVGGAIITLDLQMTVNFAVPDRWDIGVFISNDGKDPQTRAASGGAASCAVSVLPNSSPFLDLDGPADICGDGNGSIGGGTGSGIHFMPQVTVPCQSLAGAGGNLYIPFVVSWDNQKTPPGAVCTSNTDPVPNTVSKCNAPTVVQGSVAVVVLPTIAKTDGKATIFSGDSTNYDVTITNTTGASLSGVVFKDPAVSGIAVSSLSCAAAGGATCPASTVAAMQGAGITIPAMPGYPAQSITGITNANPAVVTYSGADTYSNGDKVRILNVVGMTEVNGGDFTVANVNAGANTFQLSGINSTGYTAYTSGGSLIEISSVIFTIGATLTGSPNDTRTNTATVAAGSQANTASDTNTIVDTIAILPTTQSKTGDNGGTTTLTYTYTLYNFGLSADNITLSAVSSKGWTIGVSPTPVNVPAGGSTTITLTVAIPGSAAIGDVDSTMITATSGNNPGKTATATAVTTVTTVLTLTPSNTGGGGAGASVYYTHRVQSNASASKQVSLTPSFTSGSCAGWTSALFESNKTTALTSPVTLDPSGGYKDFVLKVSIPAGAVASSTCTATLAAAYVPDIPGTAVSVTDVTTVKNLVLYEDPGYTTENYVYPAGNNVYAKGYGLNTLKSYEYRWYNSSGVEVCTPRATSTTGTTFPDTCLIPAGGPLGTWTAQIWNTTDNVLFVQSNFYVGPDHLKANYSGADPAINTNAVIDLALHDKTNHVVPFDPLGNLVKGNPADPEGPLMITVTVGGSATIISTTLANAVITGQSVTGKLDSTTGTATLTISDSVAETVTITPVSYNGVLYGSPARDEPATVTFTGIGLHHLEIQHGSGVGLTCAASTLTLKACADAGCTSLYTGGVSGTLSATGSGMTVNWDGTTGGAAGAGFVIPGGSGSVTKNVQVATVGSVTFGITSPSPAPANATTCNFGSPSCIFTASLAGFIFSNTTTGNTYTIPAQVSGIATPTLYLRAVQATTANPAVCTPAIISQTTAVNMGYACNNPATCQAGNLTTINATAIAPAGTSVNLTFDANGSAPITARYDDAGQITLNASKTATPFGGATAVTLSGSSNPYVVAPHHFGFSGITAGPIKAGINFGATVTAYNGLATPTATSNFGKETVAEGATLAFTKCQPTGINAVNGVFGGSVGSFNNGAASAANLNWSDVGNGDLIATLTSGSYLGSSLTVTGNTGTGGTACNVAGNVGAFIPDHFITTVTDGCTGCGFTYSGQPFTVVVTAMNGLATPTPTFNYDGTINTSPNFANNVSLSDANAAASPVGLLGVSTSPMGVTVNAVVPATTPPSTTLTVPKADFTQGVATLTAVPTYTFNTSPTAPTTIKMRAVDTVNAPVTSSGFTEGTTEIRSGRAKISNVYGSELLPLSMTATVQYYNAAGSWVTSTTDSVTSLTLGLSNYQCKTGCAWTTTLTPLIPLTPGVFSFSLSKPTGGGTGSVDVSVSAPNYLLTGNNGAAVNPSITGRATFGVYRGSSDFIYLRESY